MTREEKQLLLTDLCARLPFGIKILDIPANVVGDPFLVSTTDIVEYEFADEPNDEIGYQTLYNIKLYLRPMSSMTEEEEKEFNEIIGYKGEDVDGWTRCNNVYTMYGIYLPGVSNLIDWLLAHHFDFRGLIPMGLALEAKEGMYKTEKDEDSSV